MNVSLDAAVQGKLLRLAAECGRDAEVLAREAEVEKGLAQIDRGEVLTHGRVGSRLENLLAEKQSRT
jgi:predicted transcriptional regulator